jgi:hypothetical protein
MGPTLLLHSGVPNGSGGEGDFRGLRIGGIGEGGNSLLSISLTFSLYQKYRGSANDSANRNPTHLLTSQMWQIAKVRVSTFGLHALRVTIKYVCIFILSLISSDNPI